MAAQNRKPLPELATAAFAGKDDERRVLRHGANSAVKRRAGFLVTLAAQHPEPSLGLDAEHPGKELTT
jgi:hypothetical protein